MTQDRAPALLLADQLEGDLKTFTIDGGYWTLEPAIKFIIASLRRAVELPEGPAGGGAATALLSAALQWARAEGGETAVKEERAMAELRNAARDYAESQRTS